MTDQNPDILAQSEAHETQEKQAYPPQSRPENPPLPDVAYLDPALIIDLGPERLEDDADERLENQLRNETQLEPIVCARHEGEIYLLSGARRLAGAKALGCDVLAVIHSNVPASAANWVGLSLNRAQENHSYIERALWVHREYEAGRSRGQIAAIAGIPYSEISRMLAVVNGISRPLIDEIGRAPGIGRRRWQALAEALARLELVPDTRQWGFGEIADSDERFLRALQHLRRLAPNKRTSKTVTTLFGHEREPVGQFIEQARSIAFRFRKRVSNGFATWLKAELPQIHARFKREGSLAADDPLARAYNGDLSYAPDRGERSA